MKKLQTIQVKKSKLVNKNKFQLINKKDYKKNVYTKLQVCHFLSQKSMNLIENSKHLKLNYFSLFFLTFISLSCFSLKNKFKILYKFTHRPEHILFKNLNIILIFTNLQKMARKFIDLKLVNIV